jgi:hypothetical protein
VCLEKTCAAAERTNQKVRKVLDVIRKKEKNNLSFSFFREKN